MWGAAEGRDEARVALVQLLQRESPLLLHEVDQPEVARAEHDGVTARRRRSSSASAGAPVASPDGVADHRGCSSPPANSFTSVASSERSTRSSSP